MRQFLTLLLSAAVLLCLSAAQIQTRNAGSSSIARIIDEADLGRSRKVPDNERHIKQVAIRNQVGLDGKVQRIRLGHYSDEDKPGIRAYGLPKRRFPNNGVIQRIYVEGWRRVDGASRSSRLVEAYGMPKDNVNTNGFIESLSSAPSADRQSGELDSRDEKVRARRNVREGSDANEAEDMIPQDSKVFRPLFVYRQQVAARKRRNHARNAAHESRRYAPAHQPCQHRRY